MNLFIVSAVEPVKTLKLNNFDFQLISSFLFVSLHSCPDNQNSAKVIKFKEELKKAARTTRQDLKVSYDLALQNADPDAQVLLPYDVARHAMRRERQKNYPSNIYLPEEVTAFLENSESPEKENYHKTLTIDVDGKTESVLIL